MSELTRRHFCILTGAGILGSACGSGPTASDGGAAADLGLPSDMALPPPDLANPDCPVNGKLSAGPTTKFAVGTQTFFSCARVFVLRDAAGLYAMTSICTHEQCDVMFTPVTDDFQCPCHLSEFDLNGGVVMGPATKPLVHFLLTVDGSGNVVVDLNTTVAASTRVAVQD